MGAGGYKAHSFFVVVLVVGKLIFMNSLVSILLSNFYEARMEADLMKLKADKILSRLGHVM